jgi:hypothetical protein
MGSKAEAVAWSKLRVASSDGQRSIIFASQVEQDELCSRTDAVACLRSWERHRWGMFIVGRRGHDSRFQISGAAIVALRRMSAAPTGRPDSTPTPAKPTFIDHVFKFRPDTELKLSLPSDLTDREASRIARFVEAIPL